MRILFLGFLCLCSFLNACGYQASRTLLVPNVHKVFVQVRHTDVSDLDAPVLLEQAVRKELLRRSGFELVKKDDADAHLLIDLFTAPSRTLPMTEISLRAAQYQQDMTASASLVDQETSQVLRATPTLNGDGDYLSSPGSLEEAEGRRRRALGEAAERLAERIVLSLLWQK